MRRSSIACKPSCLRPGRPPRLAEAEVSFANAMTVARFQEARLFEVRAAMSLSRLPCGTEQRNRRRALLGSIYGTFTEGFGMPDLMDARVLLNS